MHTTRHLRPRDVAERARRVMSTYIDPGRLARDAYTYAPLSAPALCKHQPEGTS